MTKKQKKSKPIYFKDKMRNYTKVNIVTTIAITVFIAIVLVVSMAYVVYTDNTEDGKIPKARDIVTIHFLQLCMGAIENEIDVESAELGDIGRIFCGFVEKQKFCVFIEVNHKRYYSTCGITKDYFTDGFSEKRAEWISNGANLLLVDDDSTLMSEHVKRDDGNIVTIYLRGMEEQSQLKIATFFSHMTPFHFTLMIIFFIFLIMAFYVNSVNKMYSDIQQPLELITNALLETRQGNYERKDDIYFDVIEFNDIYLDFEKTKDKLKEAEEEDKRKKESISRIISSLTHDARTVITSIKGYSMGLMENIANTSEKRDKYYSTIYKSSCVLEHLAKDISSILRFNEPTLSVELEPLPVVYLFNECVKEYEQENIVGMNNFSIHTRFDCPKDVFVNVDQFRMNMAFKNIIGNSFKYRDQLKEKSIVIITITKLNDNVEIVFADNGRGVRKEDLPRLFEMFYRTDEARSDVAKGSGIGLAIVKSTIDMFGGTIEAVNNNMGGLSLAITLPIYKPNVEESEPVVDDNPQA